MIIIKKGKNLLIHVSMLANTTLLSLLVVMGATEYFFEDQSPTGLQWGITAVIVVFLLSVMDSSIGEVTRRSLLSVVHDRKMKKIHEEIERETARGLELERQAAALRKIRDSLKNE